jgi:hypothetical protein
VAPRHSRQLRHLGYAALASSCACALVLFGVRPAAAAPGPVSEGFAAAWVRPVDGELVRAFDTPAARYGAGHLGVDFRAAPGIDVRAAGAGEVTFAGTIAGTVHVVVAHAGGLRTSYSFLARASVRRGQHVEAGAVIGSSGGSGANHDGVVVHLGLRSGDTYVDPMLLYGAIDLAEVVHLAPTSEPFGYSVARERRGVLDGLRGLGDAVIGAGGALADGAAAAVEPIAEVGYALGARYVERARRTFAGFPPTGGLGAGIATGQVLAGYWREQRECDDHAPPADGTGGSGHHAMVIAGLGSRRSEHGASLGIPVEQLGYGDGEVDYFSYADDGGAYDAVDTYGPLLDVARGLATQLREQQREHPGREVDLIAHSQGGVVALAFLKLVYDAMDPTYPPLGTVVTLAAPLEGAPLATLLDEARDVPGIGERLLDAVDRASPEAVPDLQGGAIEDLAEDSAFMARLEAAVLPGSVRVTAIGAMWDVTVPGDRATAGGQDGTVVDAGVWNAHSAIVDDPDALRAVRAALEARPMPCRGFLDYVRGSTIAPAITLVESYAGGFPGTTGYLVPR